MGLWVGCISATENEKQLLESLGIVLGDYDHENTEYKDCVVSDEALDKLDKYWGQFFWSLDPVEVVH